MTDSHADNARCAARLERLVERQHTLFVSLDALGEAQREHIDRDDADGLLRILGERQRLVDELTGIGEESAPLHSRWEELSHALSRERREALRRRIEDLRAIAARVHERDERDRAELERRRASLADQIIGVVRNKGAIAAYARAPGAPQAGYQDTEG